VASTSSGDDPKEVVAPGVSLRAESRSSRSAGRATVGSDSTGSTSTADAERNDAGGVQATAIARSDALRVLDRLTLAGVVAEASTTVDDAGTRTSRSSLRIDAIDAAGLIVSVPATTPKGGPPDMPPLVSGQPAPPKPPPSEPTPLPAGGTKVTGPVLRFADGGFTVVSGTGGRPTETPVPAATVADAFRKVGIEMTYQAAQPTATGIVAPVLSFRTTLPAVPDNPTALQGPTTVTVDIGRVTTSVTGHSGPDAGIGVDPIAGLPVPSGAAAASAASRPIPLSDAVSGAMADIGAGPAADLTDVPAVGELASGPQSPAAAAPAAMASAAAPKLARALGRTVNARNVYVVFMALAGVGLAASWLVRTLGVRF
jgi:hypothetical protein